MDGKEKLRFSYGVRMYRLVILLILTIFESLKVSLRSARAFILTVNSHISEDQMHNAVVSPRSLVHVVQIFVRTKIFVQKFVRTKNFRPKPIPSVIF